MWFTRLLRHYLLGCRLSRGQTTAAWCGCFSSRLPPGSNWLAGWRSWASTTSPLCTELAGGMPMPMPMPCHVWTLMIPTYVIVTEQDRELTSLPCLGDVPTATSLEDDPGSGSAWTMLYGHGLHGYWQRQTIHVLCALAELHHHHIDLPNLRKVDVVMVQFCQSTDCLPGQYKRQWPLPHLHW